MEKITSFQIDHRKINPGMYISRIDGDITTFDLRVKKPNAGDYMSHIEMHTTEHMIATFIRNSEIGQNVIYFGPMGCRTGFYLLTRDLTPATVLTQVKKVLLDVTEYCGEVFGASEEECGNYKELDLESAKKICRDYLHILESYSGIDSDFEYPQ